MDSHYSQVFDDWDRDGPDISMVDLGESGYERDLSERQPLSHTRNTSYHDDRSSRSLLRPQSFATLTSNSNSSPKDGKSIQEGSPEVDNEGLRQRLGISSNFPKLWHKKSFTSQRTTSTFDGQFAHGKPGWWKKQMLVDRSLRTMAAFTMTCALVMLIIVLSYLPDFAKRRNKNSTSVGGSSGESCESMEKRNVFVHFVINIMATFILGCSNTYQQLVTALKVTEMRWVLSKRGDSRVGTNSPWAINHKQSGKLKAWLAWILLIATSVPVHFLANSLVGPSFYISMPTTVTYNEGPLSGITNYTDSQGTYYRNAYQTTNAFDSSCWVAFRAGSYVLPTKLSTLARGYRPDTLGNSTTFLSVDVESVGVNCSQYQNTSTVEEALQEFTYYSRDYHSETSKMFAKDNCVLGNSVRCVLGDEQEKKCRLNVRMQAAFTLMGCLMIKGIYMLLVNYRARSRTKDVCLTYGDVIIASVLDPELKIQNECLLNAGDGYRHSVQHTCHKHCKDPTPSATGDDIGHCQKCKKFNKVNMAADLPHPTVAIKYKRSLLSNLGSTAVSQMIILMICSLVMLAISLLLAVSIGTSANSFKEACRQYPQNSYRTFDDIGCEEGISKLIKAKFGTWGGFSSSASLGGLPADSISSEFTAFAISNGAQFLYSLLYLLLIYNITLIIMEHEWGKLETERRKPRCTIVSGRPFEQSYFLQLPSRILFPMMAFSASMHWLLGAAISTTESIFTDPINNTERSIYFVTYASYPIFMSTILMIAMTSVCWWAFTFTREGFIPQMYGSIRACCASTTELTDFSAEGIVWGDLGMGEKFRHAGFTTDDPEKIIPGELYS